ncbi:MAG: hypothetical protein AB7V56_06850 [Candidatus Nitrosocosmicus sp.]
MKFYLSILWSLVLGIIPILPSFYIYNIFQSSFSLPIGLSETLFTTSAAALSILLAATTFLFDRLHKESIAALDDYPKYAEILDDEKANIEKRRYAFYDLKSLQLRVKSPRILTSIIIRSLFLLVVCLIISGWNYFSGNKYGLDIALLSFIFFLFNIAYGMTKVLYNIFIDTTQTFNLIDHKLKVNKGILEKSADRSPIKGYVSSLIQKMKASDNTFFIMKILAILAIILIVMPIFLQIFLHLSINDVIKFLKMVYVCQIIKSIFLYKFIHSI